MRIRLHNVLSYVSVGVFLPLIKPNKIAAFRNNRELPQSVPHMLAGFGRKTHTDMQKLPRAAHKLFPCSLLCALLACISQKREESILNFGFFLLAEQIRYFPVGYKITNLGYNLIVF